MARAEITPRRGCGGSENLGYRVDTLVLQDDATLEHFAIEPNGSLEIAVSLRSGDGRAPGVSIGIVRADGTPIYGLTSAMAGVRPRPLDDGRFEYRVRFDALPLLPGSYTIRAHAMDPECARLFDVVTRSFEMVGEDPSFGFCRLEHRWVER